MSKRGLAEVVAELRLLPKAFLPLLRSVKRFVLSSDVRPTTRYEIAIVLLLSDAAQNYARRTQLELLKQYRIEHGISAEPHVTLKLGFKTFDIHPIEEYFDQLAREIDAVEIMIRNFGFFDEGIVFLDIEPNPPLEDLRKRILSALRNKFSIQPHPIEGDAYHFHATVAHGLCCFVKLFVKLSRARRSDDILGHHGHSPFSADWFAIPDVARFAPRRTLRAGSASAGRG